MKRTIPHIALALCVVGAIRAEQTVQSVQQALKDQGFYFGSVTGDKSAETNAAIRRYQIRNGLKVTGEIDPETLRSLNMPSNLVSSSQPASKPAVAQSNPPPPPDQGAPAGQNPAPQSPSAPDPQLETPPAFSAAPYQPMPRRINQRMAVAEVQRQLMMSGYYRGRIDGKYGPRTAFAMRAFQFQSGLPTGRLDPSTFNALGLSDSNLAYLQPAPRSYEMWAPITKFKDGKWKVKWKKHHRDDDEYGDEDRDEKADDWRGDESGVAYADDRWKEWRRQREARHEAAKKADEYEREAAKEARERQKEYWKARAEDERERAKAYREWLRERNKSRAEHRRELAKDAYERAKEEAKNHRE
jgi:peptidoglycan hydrolase-like protein with peptidoglycan-binding domain